MARVRTNKNICLYCFGDLDGNRVCMNCHRKADDTPSPPHHLPQRTVLGTQNRYLIGKALGEGGFGITYLAWDLQQGIKVAVKEYFPSGYVTRVAGSNQVIINSKQNQAASNRGLKRFVEEARALAKIKNLAGVVNVRDFFSANGTAYIVMEFLDGVSLKKYLQRKGGKIPVDEVLTIMRPVMESLTQVHKIGLVHRDISPDNIIITKYNEVKLIDFGAAKYSNPDGKSLSIVLKQGFAPPEQYDTHGEQGPWTDVYALGVTLYYSITGTLPPESIRVMMGKEAIKRPSELGIEIDPGVENGLMKSLAVDKKKRYQDVQSMMNGLYNPRAPRKTSVATATAPTAQQPKRTVIARTAIVTDADASATAKANEKTTPSNAAKARASSAAKAPATGTAKPTANTAAGAAKSMQSTTARATATRTPSSATGAAKLAQKNTAKAQPQSAAKPAAKPNASAVKAPTAKSAVQKDEPAAKPDAKNVKDPKVDKKDAEAQPKKTTGGLFSRLFKK